MGGAEQGLTTPFLLLQLNTTPLGKSGTHLLGGLGGFNSSRANFILLNIFVQNQGLLQSQHFPGSKGGAQREQSYS